MSSKIEDLVIGFYNDLYEEIFTRNFRDRLPDTRKRRAVERQVEECADAASASLARLFKNERLSEQPASDLLQCLAGLGQLLTLESLARRNLTPGSLVEDLAPSLPCPAAIEHAGKGPAYRVAMHLVVQSLILVGQVMAEWERISFAATYEPPKGLVKRLNQISAQMDSMARYGPEAADDRYELIYRDYLIQRFFQIEAGTVKMTTNLNVDIRDLFVMPTIQRRPGGEVNTSDGNETELMDLMAARRIFKASSMDENKDQKEKGETKGIPALDQIKRYPLNAIVGAPGSGKTTFLEWLQLALANVGEQLEMAGAQAIPLLLRVRQLDSERLPQGDALVAQALASRDVAELGPAGWIERQMRKGRVLFMLDGLDEVEPELRDRSVIPWFLGLVGKYQRCRFLISSRPVGYPAGLLQDRQFAECDLLDFDPGQMKEYICHWCTAVRLAQKEPAEEARCEGDKEGEQIFNAFREHPYIRHLARNPLMLSAICLVNYFEKGQLPQDRVRLYELCAEGLLHNWDQRRGIRSEFGLEEKLRDCRNLALAMQSDRLAEYEDQRVLIVFSQVLGDPDRAARLLEHIRYRSGILIERRPKIFAFAHLTFQEYLAARAIRDGNILNLTADQLVKEHEDPRWSEVLPLYCGLAPSPEAEKIIEMLIEQPDTDRIGEILGETYLSAGAEIHQDKQLRTRVIKRIAEAPSQTLSIINRFNEDEVAPIANSCLGTIKSNHSSHAYLWLFYNKNRINIEEQKRKLMNWPNLSPAQKGEIVHLLYRYCPDSDLSYPLTDLELLGSSGPFYSSMNNYHIIAIVALHAIFASSDSRSLLPANNAILAIFRALTDMNSIPYCEPLIIGLRRFSNPPLLDFPFNKDDWPEFIKLMRKLCSLLSQSPPPKDPGKTVLELSISGLNSWADRLEEEYEKRMRKEGE